MNLLWKTLPRGKDRLIGIIKSDWAKLKYVGDKLDGDWSYDDIDRWDWVDQVTDTLLAYYFQSLIPAAWKIDYYDFTTEIPHPKNFAYEAGGQYGDCLPYCSGASDNPDAFWVDKLPYEPDPNTYTWFVLEDEIDMAIMSGCGFVHFDRSAGLRDVLFGEGAWAGGQKLNLELYVFYERWLPSWVYTPYVPPPAGPYIAEFYYSECD
jgi:hypothetical protein